MWGLWLHQPLVGLVSWEKLGVCSEITVLSLDIFGNLFSLFLSIALPSGCLLPLVTCHCLIGSFGEKLGLVVMLFAVICSTDEELPLCLCSIAFVVLLVIRWGSYIFPQLFNAGRPARHNLAMHPFILVCLRCRTSQYLRTFIPVCVSLWNMLDESDFAGDGLGAFKTSVNRTLISLSIFWTYIFFLSRSFIFLNSLLSWVPIVIRSFPLILLRVAIAWVFFGLIGSGIYSRCHCLLLA